MGGDPGIAPDRRMGRLKRRGMRTTAYRYPGEHLILALTLFLVSVVIVLTAAATVCSSLLFIVAFLALSYSYTQSHHQDLMKQAQPVSAQTMPALDEILREGVARIQPGPVEAYVLPSGERNAYTFGLSTPKVVVVYSGLLRAMDRDEVLFVVGHELGHVALGHTWLNSMIGGISGIPSSFGAAVVLRLAFLWWNRSCELSADRAGLLACGSPEKAVSAMVKLAAGGRSHTAQDLEQAYREIDAEDDTWAGGLNEMLATHPMLIRRINEIRRYAATAQYRRLAGMMDAGGETAARVRTPFGA